jgi:hypothetical protein
MRRHQAPRSGKFVWYLKSWSFITGKFANHMNGVNIRIITVTCYTIECDGEDYIGILTGFLDLVATLFTYVLIYKKKNYKNIYQSCYQLGSAFLSFVALN